MLGKPPGDVLGFDDAGDRQGGRFVELLNIDFHCGQNQNNGQDKNSQGASHSGTRYRYQ
jgi:hypothetical protein